MLDVALPIAAANPHEVVVSFEMLLPVIQRQAMRAFRFQQASQRGELIAEVVGRAYWMFCRLVKRGLARVAYASALAKYAIRQVLSGRRLGNGQNVRDVLSEVAQQRKRFAVVTDSGLDRRAWEEVTADYRANPAEIATFRLDFAAWLARLSPPKRNVVKRLAAGDTPGEAAQCLHVSPGRISQLRRELKLDWDSFQSNALLD